MVRSLLQRLYHAPRDLAIAMIRLYQQTLSPDHGPLRHLYPYGYCRHSPTCSAYAMEQLKNRGFLIGSILALARIITCNPWKRPSDERLREVTNHSQ